MYALGIDVGTTFVAAAVHRAGRSEICSLGRRSALAPAVVLLRADGVHVTGDDAARRGAVEPLRVAREVWRRLGDGTPVVLGGTPVPARTLVAHLLADVVERVERAQGCAPEAICLTYPASWGPHRQQLLRDAAGEAALPGLVTCVPSPVAAVAALGTEEAPAVGECVVVHDIGGGTFEAAVVRRAEHGLELAGVPEGIERLGGADVDAAVFAHVLRIVADRAGSCGRDLVGELAEDDPAAVAGAARLRADCVLAKEALSVEPWTTVPVTLPGLSTSVRLVRAELEALVRPALDSTVAATRRAVRSAGLADDDVQAVLLVGGACRMPLVAQVVGTELGRPVGVAARPDHVVALGAAALAASRVAARVAVPPGVSVPGVSAGRVALLLPSVPPSVPRQHVPATRGPLPPSPPPSSAPRPRGGAGRSRRRSRTRTRDSVLLGVLVGLLLAAAAGGGYLAAARWRPPQRAVLLPPPVTGPAPTATPTAIPTATAAPASDAAAGAAEAPARVPGRTPARADATARAKRPADGAAEVLPAARTGRVTVVVQGSGSVTGPDRCRSTCTTTLVLPARVTLEAVPAEGHRFSGWLGCPAVAPSSSPPAGPGAGASASPPVPCAFAVPAGSTTVTAVFEPLPLGGLTGLAVEVAVDGRLHATWPVVAGATGYRFTWLDVTSSGAEGVPVATGTTVDPQAWLDAVTPGHRYRITVAATDGTRTGPPATAGR